MITLTHANGTIVLPKDLDWPDEFEWTPAVTSEQRTMTGALVIHHSVAQSGRPITLASGDGSWCARDTVLALQAIQSADATLIAAGSKPSPMTLSYHGRVFEVTWRRAETIPFEATPVFRYAYADGTHPYLITLRLMEI